MIVDAFGVDRSVIDARRIAKGLRVASRERTTIGQEEEVKR
jgi:hypothetical protein